MHITVLYLLIKITTWQETNFSSFIQFFWFFPLLMRRDKFVLILCYCTAYCFYKFWLVSYNKIIESEAHVMTMTNNLKSIFKQNIFLIVEPRLNQPHLKLFHTENDIKLEIFSLCCQLELLCKKTYCVSTCLILKTNYDNILSNNTTVVVP